MDEETIGKVADAAKETAITLREPVEVLARGIAPLAEEGGLLAAGVFKVIRERCVESVFKKADDILDERGVPPEAEELISVRTAIPLLEAVSEESNETLQDMWARLIANARDPDRDTEVRPEFMEVLRNLEPSDALLLEQIYAAQDTKPMGKLVGFGTDQFVLMWNSLSKLECVTGSMTANRNISKLRTPLGRELMRACWRETEPT